MATFDNGESNLSIRTKINNVLQHLDGSAGEVVVNDAGADVNFRVESDTNANALFVDGGTGNVGIGTSAPAVDLHIANSVIPRLRLEDSGSGQYAEIFTNNDDLVIGSDEGNTGGGSTIAFRVDASERMRIDSTGNVGIGTSSPDTKLEISASNATAGLGNGGLLKLTNTNGAAFNQRAEILFENVSQVTSAISSSYTSFSAGSYAGDLILATKGIADASIQERLRITSTGNVGIGTSSPAALLEVAGPTSKFRINDTNRAGYSEITAAATGGGLNFNADPDNLEGSTSIRFSVDGSEHMRIDSSGNVLIGGTAAGTASAGNLVLFNGTAPTGNVTNGVTLYAEDVSSSSELKVRDEAGNVTTLSPHNFDLIPEGPSEEMAWSYYSERDGKRINVDMLKAIRLLEQISGEKLVHMT